MSDLLNFFCILIDSTIEYLIPNTPVVDERILIVSQNLYKNDL